MRNYIMFHYGLFHYHDTLLDGHEYYQLLARDPDELDERGFLILSQLGQPRWELLGVDKGKQFLELNRDQIFHMFDILQRRNFDNIVSFWVEEDQYGGPIRLFVDKSPRKTWSHGS